MNKKLQRELNGPSWTEVILGAVLSLVLGAALAFVFLVLKPVATVKELPKEPVEGVVYYLEGARDASKARQAPAKQQTFLQGGRVVLAEEELNALAAASAASSNAPRPAQTAPAADASAARPAMAGTPNFRIREGVLQIAIPLQIAAAGLERRVVVQARGGFAKAGETFVFEPSELYIGSCPVQRLPLAPAFLMKRFRASLEVPEEVAVAWQNLSDVAVDGSTLRLEM